MRTIQVGILIAFLITLFLILGTLTVFVAAAFISLATHATWIITIPTLAVPVAATCAGLLRVTRIRHSYATASCVFTERSTHLCT